MGLQTEVRGFDSGSRACDSLAGSNTGQVGAQAEGNQSCVSFISLSVSLSLYLALALTLALLSSTLSLKQSIKIILGGGLKK